MAKSRKPVAPRALTPYQSEASRLGPLVTDSVWADRRVQYLRESQANTLSSAEKALAKFAQDLATDPVRALSWSLGEFKDAAQRHVAQEVLSIIASVESEGDYSGGSMMILRSLRRYYGEEVLRRSRWPARSTSPTSNLMEVELAAAKAEVLESINGWFDYREQEEFVRNR